MAKKKKLTGKGNKSVETIQHGEDKRRNIPTAEYQSVMRTDERNAIQVAFERRNRDLDPQLIWRGKDGTDWSDLVVNAPPLYIQEKVHPKVLIDELMRSMTQTEEERAENQPNLFDQFNGVPTGVDKTEFYQHEQNWSNRMILGDGLQVMASLAEREGLRGKVQCVFVDPPYGIKFNSNFQWSTSSLDVKDGKAEHITREPEQVKAFRDTWRDGVHSYLTYLRDRVSVARDLLTETGSIFVQIGDENVHLVRSLLDEVYGPENFVSQISFVKAGALGATGLPRRLDYILWYSKKANAYKYRKFLIPKDVLDRGSYNQVVQDDYTLRPLSKQEKLNPKEIPLERLCRTVSFTKPGPGSRYPLFFEGEEYNPGRRWWGFPENSTEKLIRAGRLIKRGKSVESLRYWNDYAAQQITNLWTDTGSGSGMDKIYVVQTNTEVVKRCLLMATDPGDLVLDPTCGSGTTAFVAEQWGRRWITVDTSRVSLALARSRIMGAKYPYYILVDSVKGQEAEAKLKRCEPSSAAVFGNIKHGFVCGRVPHITLKAISKNSELDVIWQKYDDILQPILKKMNSETGANWCYWGVPRDADQAWSEQLKVLHTKWWTLRFERQREIDASIAAKSDFELLLDRPIEEKSVVRVSGPFTVESLWPHRMLTVDAEDELVEQNIDAEFGEGDFAALIIENLKLAGVQQSNKDDRIKFESLEPWPGDLIAAEGVFRESDEDSAVKRAAIFIGPEFGTVTRPDLVESAREAADAGFDLLIACAFNYEAHTTEFSSLGKIPVLKARMNADLHMSKDLKNTGKGNLFVIFGEPDIEMVKESEMIRVKIKGVDVFDPSTGEVRSDGPDGIACWFVDTEYNEESFFVRHAYFLGASDPYKSLKKTLKEEVNEEAWESLYSDISRPFKKPKSGRIAVKVINHLGDEVMKVMRVE